MSNRLSVELSLNAKGYQSEMDKSKDATKDFNDAVNSASKSTEQYTNTIGTQTKDLASLRKALSAAKKDAQNLAMAYSQLSKEEKNSAIGRQMKKQLDEAIKSAAEFQDVLGDVSTQIKNVANDIGTWDALKEGIETTGSVLSTIGGVYASITGDQQSFNRAVAMFTTTQAAANTIAKVANALQKESNLMIKIAAVQEWARQKAVLASTTATKGATIAQAAFNAVAMANPYVLLAAAIGGLVTVLGAFAVAANKARAEQKRLNDEIARGRITSEALDESMDYTIRLMRAEGKSELEVLNYQLDRYQKNLEGSSSRVDDLNKRLEKVRNRINSGSTDYSDYQEQKSILQEISIEEEKQSKINEHISELTKERTIELVKAKHAAEEEAKKQQESLKTQEIKLPKIKETVQQEEKELTTMQKLQNKQKELNSLLQEAVAQNDRISIAKYSKQLTEVNDQIDEINKGVERAIELNKKLTVKGIEPVAPVTVGKDNIQKREGPITPKLDTDKIFDGVHALDSMYGSMMSLVDAVENGANAWEVFVGVISTVETALKTMQTVMEAVTMVQQLMGATTQRNAAISSAASAQQVANNTAEAGSAASAAVAEGTKSGAKLPFPLNIAAIAAVLAAVMGALAMMNSFATGGIVGGSSFHGDNMVARVNSGEMILNSRQQKNMFNAIDHGNLGGAGHVEVTGNIKVKGSDLYLALKNNDKKISKIK